MNAFSLAMRGRELDCGDLVVIDERTTGIRPHSVGIVVCRTVVDVDGDPNFCVAWTGQGGLKIDHCIPAKHVNVVRGAA